MVLLDGTLEYVNVNGKCRVEVTDKQSPAKPAMFAALLALLDILGNYDEQPRFITAAARQVCRQAGLLLPTPVR